MKAAEPAPMVTLAPTDADAATKEWRRNFDAMNELDGIASELFVACVAAGEDENADLELVLLRLSERVRTVSEALAKDTSSAAKAEAA